MCNSSDILDFCRGIRTHVIELSHRGKTPHLGSSLSCVDLISVLYREFLKINPSHSQAPERDRFFLSKGHAVTALYSVLAHRKFFEKAELDAYYNIPGFQFPEHPSRFCVPGVEASTGSLGHGLGLGIGVCLGNRIQGINADTYVLLSDGECNEGSIWEGAMFASAQRLNRLCVIVDFNKWQATGRSSEIMALEPLEKKFESFGWNVIRIDGHCIDSIRSAFKLFLNEQERPFAIIADTVKGKGVSFMEDDNNWHYRIPNEEEVLLAKKELEFHA